MQSEPVRANWDEYPAWQKGSMMPQGEHELDLAEDFVDGTWCASCSCGWESKERNAEADAVEDWENHCDVVFMESTTAGRRR